MATRGTAATVASTDPRALAVSGFFTEGSGAVFGVTSRSSCSGWQRVCSAG